MTSLRGIWSGYGLQAMACEAFESLDPITYRLFSTVKMPLAPLDFLAERNLVGNCRAINRRETSTDDVDSSANFSMSLYLILTGSPWIIGSLGDSVT
jgi:hypothetical protein